MKSMLESGEFVISGKLLSSAPMDKDRSENAWQTILQPQKTSLHQVSSILFGSTAVGVDNDTSDDNYLPAHNVQDFKPEDILDSDLVDFLKFNLLSRRNNILLHGPAGTGKTSLVHALTHAFGVKFVSTPDDLKNVDARKTKFVIFDDFDWHEIPVDTIKRLMDRESNTQRIKVRYKDAVLYSHMCRIVICNDIPVQFDNDAVASRMILRQVQGSLFVKTSGQKFRGSHLKADQTAEQYDEETFDPDGSEHFPSYSWSFGASGNSNSRAKAVNDAQDRQMQDSARTMEGTNNSAFKGNSRAQMAAAALVK